MPIILKIMMRLSQIKKYSYTTPQTSTSLHFGHLAIGEDETPADTGYSASVGRRFQWIIAIKYYQWGPGAPVWNLSATSAARRPGRGPTGAAEPALACGQLHAQVHTPAITHRVLKPCAKEALVTGWLALRLISDWLAGWTNLRMWLFSAERKYSCQSRSLLFVVLPNTPCN